MDGEKSAGSGRDGFFEEEDAEAAAICLSCPRAVCQMDRNKPCLRYRRAIRALKQARAKRSGETGKTDREDPLQIAMGVG